MDFQQFMALLTAVAVPTVAFIIRMSEGDTKNENEEVISKFVRRIVDYFKGHLANWRTA